MSDVVLSKYQEDIINFVASGEGSAFVSASAGSAKSFTLIESSKHIPSHVPTLMVAFNKHIATELQMKVAKPNITIKTLNSLGFTAWKQYTGIYKRDYLNPKKTEEVLEDSTTYENLRFVKKFQYIIKQLVSKAKHNGLVPNIPEFRNLKGLTPDTVDNWKHFITFYGLNDKIKAFAIEEVAKSVLKRGKLSKEEAERFIKQQEEEINLVEDNVQEMIISIAKDVLIKSIRLKKIVIDFDDQIYLPIIHRAKVGDYQFIYIDELQDLSRLNVELLKLCAAEKCRAMGFGDERQRIYTWRGADQNSIETFVDYFKCEKLPLTICYRCSKAVIKEAQKVNNDIEAWEDAPEGIVDYIQDILEDENANLSEKDMILCRFNAPLINLALRMITKNIPIQFVGKDIEAQLKTLVSQFTIAPEINTVKDVRTILDDWYETQKSRLTKKYGSEEDIPGEELNPVRDIFFCLSSILNTLPGEGLIADIYNKIDSIFKSTNGVKLSSVHRSKGLEANRVYFLDRDKLPSGNIKSVWQRVEEDNIIYVGITRAKHTLIYCQSDTDFREKYYKENKSENKTTSNFTPTIRTDVIVEEPEELLPEEVPKLHDHIDYGFELDDILRRCE